MNIETSIPARFILGVYLLAHAVIVTAVFWARRNLPANRRASVSRWLLISTALPLIGPIMSCFGFARLARSYQMVVSQNPTFRSDCGFAAGIGYGLTSMVASWTSSPGVGFLSLCCLILFFVQLWLAGKVGATEQTAVARI